MGRIVMDVQVVNQQDMVMFKNRAISADQVRQMTIKGIIDTGCNYLILPTSVVERLGLGKVGEARVRYGHEGTDMRDMVDLVELEILGRKGSYHAISEPNRNTALIGAIIMEDMDFILDPGNQRIYPRDPERIIAEVGDVELVG